MRSIENRQHNTRLVNLEDSTDNGLATVTAAADAEHTWVVESIHASYSQAPAAGANLIIKDGATTVATIYTGIAGGLTRVVFEYGGFAISKNAALTVTLSAGGSGVIGSIVVQYS